ncbi:MAG: primosomal protein N' [Eubacteriales bacterium]|nr:primosomal protein N' [Eubacteriales bacterium]
MTEKDKHKIYADIIIDISHEALDKVFQYRVPFSLQEAIRPGVKVRIPFGKGNQEREGYVIHLSEKSNYPEEKMKDILSLSKNAVPMESQMIEMAAFLKYQYGSSMYQALKTVMPVKERIRPKMTMQITLLTDEYETENLRKIWERRHFTARLRFLEALCHAPDHSLSREEMNAVCSFSRKDLEKMEEQKIILLQEKMNYRNPFSNLKKKEEKLPLNEEQRLAAEEFCKDFGQGIRKNYLLYGVTGSGKTEVYLALIEEVLKQGMQAIVLIPEISLTYQTVRRFYERFGEQIAVLHSRMSKGERSDSYLRIEAGEANIVIGARSALFAPTKKLGLIIIDEEHDGAYKSDSSPKYHARETAEYRAKLTGASLVLGSATPSMESFLRAQKGEYHLWTLKKRGGQALLPEVTVVDLKEEFKEGNRSIFSRELQEKIRDRLAKKEQIMLFLNRRGFAGFVSCRSCGTVMKCPHCDISLTYHRNGSLRCHYCGFESRFDRQCPVCKSAHVAAFGLGTEKVEAALAMEFPEARVLRMDMDTTKKKNAHEEILRTFSRGEADILLGTQMIVKGHDYANVTLVGIIAADLSLHAQDFRSGEKTFQLLCQAAGRAGRGQKQGDVIIQTYSPDHYAIVTAAKQSYEEFYEEEMAFRKMLHYPPYDHILVILVQSGDENQSALAIQRIQKMIVQSQEGVEHPVQIMNPGQASLSKLKDIYRQVIYLKHRDGEVLLDLKERLQPVLETHALFAGINVQFDYDPIHNY